MTKTPDLPTPTPETLVERLKEECTCPPDGQFDEPCACCLAINELSINASLLAEREREIERRLDVSGLDEEQVDGIRKHIRGLTEEKATYDAPRHGWMCFHCGETFKTEASASLHFGTVDDDFPKCAEGARAAFKMLTNRAAEQAIKHADEMVAARQKISELRKALEWQPIETAPKDTSMLLWCSWYVELGHFNTSIGAWVANYDHRKLETPSLWRDASMPEKTTRATLSSTKEDLPGGQEAPHHPQPPGQGAGPSGRPHASDQCECDFMVKK